MLQQLEQQVGCGCPYCGVKMSRGTFRPTRDHLHPRSKGGILDPGNKVIVCLPCNQAKGDLTIHEFLAALTYYRDPRARHVRRFIEGMSLYFQGRLRILVVSYEERASYPRVVYQRRVPKPRRYPEATLVPDVEERMAPALGM